MLSEKDTICRAFQNKEGYIAHVSQSFKKCYAVVCLLYSHELSYVL